MAALPFSKFDVLTAAVEYLNREVGDASLMEDYSGRFMYGETTPAIVTGEDLTVVNSAIRHAVADLIAEVEEPMPTKEAFKLANAYELRKRDNMGRDYVYY